MHGGEGQITTEQTEKNTDSEKIFGFVYASESLTACLEERLEGVVVGGEIKSFGEQTLLHRNTPDCSFYLMGMQTSPPWRLQKAV